MHIQDITNTKFIPTVIYTQELYEMNLEATALCTKARLINMIIMHTILPYKVTTEDGWK